MKPVIVVENSPILTANPEHKNFTATDKIIPAGATMVGDFKNIIGTRRGKPFTYRLFIDKDGIIVYEKNVKMNEIKMNLTGTENDRTITLPSAQKFSTTHAVVSVIAGVLGYAVAKKMGKTGKTAMFIAGGSAIAGYMVANYMVNRNITIEKK